MLFIIFVTAPIAGFPAWAAQAPPEETAPFDAVKDRAEKFWTKAGELYRQILEQGPTGNAYAELAKLFFEDDKPIQARFYYELALSLNPENKEFKDQWKKVEKRIALLEKRFQEFNDIANTKNDITGFGSMAAIKFHQGYYREAFQIVQTAVDQYGDDPRIAPLRGSFNQEIQLLAQSVDVLYKQFQKMVDEGNNSKALESFGQMIFISLGNPQVFDLLKSIKESHPEAIQEESFLLLEEFTKLYPNG